MKKSTLFIMFIITCTIFFTFGCKETFEVTFESNGGSEVASQPVVQGTYINKPTNPTLTGKVFAGWFKDKELKIIWNFANSTVHSDMTLYAKWEDPTPETFTVIFNSKGGSQVAPQSITEGSLVDEPEDPTFLGRIFEGWVKDLDTNEKWFFESDRVTGPITLYAKWSDTAPPPSPTAIVSFNTNGAAEITPIEILKDSTIAQPEDPSYVGYHLIGWFKDSEYADEWEFDTDTVTVDTTLYAKWLEVTTDTFAYMVEGSYQLNYSRTNDNREISVAGLTTPFDSSNPARGLVIPSIIEYEEVTYTVTAINLAAFTAQMSIAGALVLPETLKIIGSNAFLLCSGLNGELIIPNSVTTIGDDAFNSCSGFTSLTLGNAVTSIGKSAFNSCTGLTGGITIPNSVTTIAEGAFIGCVGYNGTLTIGESVISIGDNAFSQIKNTANKTKFAEIVSLAVIPPLTFADTFLAFESYDIPVTVPSASVNDYKAAEQWKAFTNISSIQ